MLKPNFLKLALLILTLASLALLFTSPPLQDVPTYNGQPLRFYLEQQAAGDLRQERAAREAIQAIGTNAVPALLRILSATESSLTPKLVALARRQPFVRIDHTPLRERQRLATKACEALGRQARAAVPALSKLLDVPELTPHVAAALARMSPDSVPCLIRALEHPHPEVRFYAAHALGIARGWTQISGGNRQE